MLAYGTLGTLFHDADTPRATPAEVAWYAARLPRHAGLVLEAMAGSGRLLVPLLDEGFHVHGVDNSEARIASCEKRLTASGHKAQLYRQDVAALNLPSRYAAAFIAAGSFQALANPVAALDTLLRIRAHLIDPGLLFLDLFVPAGADHPPGAPVVEVRMVTPAEGTRIGQRSETFIDVPMRRIDVRARYERREWKVITAREEETRALTWYTEEEATTLLTDAGYRDVNIEPAPWRSKDGRHFLVSAVA
ncbi:MAG TPA: class I SAM-dependent methyltransferase [Casimicrobiaceae bacterium]|nr:class I SAM-dependent methyltransferase [Casimicrobiaceae bacterium]